MPSYRQRWKAKLPFNRAESLWSDSQKSFKIEKLEIPCLQARCVTRLSLPEFRCIHKSETMEPSQRGWNKALDRFGLHWFRYQHTHSHIAMCSKRQYTNIFLLITGSSWTCVPSSLYNPRFDSILEYSGSNVAFENVLPGVYVCFILPT